MDLRPNLCGWLAVALVCSMFVICPCHLQKNIYSNKPHEN